MIIGVRSETLRYIWDMIMLLLEIAIYVLVLVVLVQWAITDVLNTDMAIGLVLVRVYADALERSKEA